MTIPTTDPREAIARTVTGWLEPLQLRNADAIYQNAHSAAAFLAGETRGESNYSVTRITADDHAYVDLQPGDGTAYRMHITLLTEQAARSLGYRLVVALPDFGACLALDAFGFHVPDYIAEKGRNLSERTAIVVAAFITLLSAHLDHLLTP